MRDYIGDRYALDTIAGERVAARPRPRWQDMDERDVAGDAAAEKAELRQREAYDIGVADRFE